MRNTFQVFSKTPSLLNLNKIEWRLLWVESITVVYVAVQRQNVRLMKNSSIIFLDLRLDKIIAAMNMGFFGDDFKIRLLILRKNV